MKPRSNENMDHDLLKERILSLQSSAGVNTNSQRGQPKSPRPARRVRFADEEKKKLVEVNIIARYIEIHMD